MGRLHRVPQGYSKEYTIMVGYRKVFVVVLVVGVTAIIPLNGPQADVLTAVLYTFVLGNVLEHGMKGKLGEKIMGMANRLRSGDSSNSGVTAKGKRQ